MWFVQKLSSIYSRMAVYLAMVGGGLSSVRGSLSLEVWGSGTYDLFLEPVHTSIYATYTHSHLCLHIYICIYIRKALKMTLVVF